MKITKCLVLASGIAASLFAAGCSESQKNETVLNGAGASFPAPVYQAWTHSYGMVNPDVKINYQSLGSGAGVNQIKAGTLDFAGTDNPLTVKELADENLSQFPMLTGGVVVICNIPDIEKGKLKLSKKALGDIFLGKITKWNDPAITVNNGSLALPELDITVVRRADASGTSFIFTDYLSKISQEWNESVGRGSAVAWPAGIGGQKNPGVCNSVSKISGAIGYTEYTYAAEAGLNMAQLENKNGAFIAPTVESFAASAEKADWANAPAFSIMLTDAEGSDAWPISGVTYIVIRNDITPEKRAALVKYFKWCFSDGAALAARLSYVPLPATAVTLVAEKVLDR